MKPQISGQARLQLATLCAAAIFGSGAGAQTVSPTRTSHSALVFPGANGHLVYRAANAPGDTIPDFSHCGYGGGGVALPDVPVKITVAPDGDEKDDLARLQAAVEAVSKLAPSATGWRGAVLVKRGRYLLGGSLQIAASGVVLRGEGQGENGTVLVATLRQQHSLIEVKGSGNLREIPGTRQNIVDDYVPVGARSFRVRDASRFKIGQAVVVHRPSTAAWIRDLGMDRIPPAKDGGTVQWQPGSKDLLFERVVTKIEGSRLTIDAPLVNALQKQYGGGSVYRSEFAGRLSHVGIENLRGESEFDPAIRDSSKKDQPGDEKHGWNLIRLSAVRDSWVCEVTSRYFGYSCVNITASARSVTVQDCECLDPVSQVTGGRRYSFAIAGQLNLVQRCLARSGRHDFVMGAAVPGPNVFLNCRAQQAYSDSGPHHRWSTGTLYDGLTTDGNLNVQNRGNSGTGHGWAGSQMVFWNCRAGKIDCQKPPTSQNYAIGCVTPNPNGDGFWEAAGQPVLPVSLYQQQLQDRLGRSAVRNISRPVQSH